MFDFPHIRPRRLRTKQSLRNLVSETRLGVSDLILPIFLRDIEGKEAIAALPGLYRWGIAEVVKYCKEAQSRGIKGIAPFPLVEEKKKDKLATESFNPDGVYLRAISEIRSACPELVIFSDVAMDPYSSEGHDGLVENGEIVNDKTLEVLAKMALAQVRAGSSWVAPSDMMDGRVRYIRQALDAEGFKDVGILSYAAKYASSFYGPFRSALDSAPKLGDKKTYQMDPGNRREAVREAELDLEEGADILMVKPALAYLDVISDLRQNFPVPIAAFNVSGEYAMLRSAIGQGMLSEEAVLETLISIKRAGADLILSYFAFDVAEKLH